MYRFFQKYHKSALGTLIGLLACIAMLGFGVNFGGSQRDQYAIKVNDREISYQEYSDYKRQLLNRYRSIFGNQFDLTKISADIVDSMVEEALLNDFAEKNELFVGSNEFRSSLERSLGGQLSRETYANFLRSVGMTAAQYESRLKESLKPSQLRDLFRHASHASRKEAVTLLKREETKVSVQYVEFDPSRIAQTLEKPSEETLKEFYTENAIDFEYPDRVRYSYILLRPENFLDLVEVYDEDIETYYAENSRKYRTPARALVRHIELKYPAGADDEKKAAVQQKATEVHQRAMMGEDFSQLVSEFSEDTASVAKHGSLGWIKKGDRAKQFEQAVFSMDGPGITELVETGSGMHVILVEEIEEEGLKDLSEVRAEIENAIKLREAPAYTAVKASELFDSWSSSELSLADFAAQNGLAAVSSDKHLGKREDPAPNAKGLSAKVLDNPSETQQILDLGAATVLVEIEDYKERDIPPFELIASDVLEAWRAEQGIETAENRAQDLIESLSKDPSSLKKIAEERDLKIEEAREILRREASGIFTNPEIQSAIFSATKAPFTAERAFHEDGKIYVLQVNEIIPPTAEVIEEKLPTFQRRIDLELARLLESTVTNVLKANAEVDIQASVMSDLG